MSFRHLIFSTFLTALALALLVPAQAAVPADPAGWQVLFQEDFEHGDGAWNSGNSIWAVENDAGSAVYSAGSHAMTAASAGPWRDFRFHLRVKVISGQLFLNFRYLQCGRYFAGLGGGPISLTRMAGCYNHTNLLTSPTGFSRGVWHVLDAVAVGASIKLYLDGTLALDYVDPNPVLLGGIALEALDDTHVHVDDIVVTGPLDTQSLNWVRTGGPHGGVGYDIRMRPDNPDYLMVTDISSGVSISTDGGKTGARPIGHHQPRRALRRCHPDLLPDHRPDNAGHRLGGDAEHARHLQVHRRRQDLGTEGPRRGGEERRSPSAASRWIRAIPISSMRRREFPAPSGLASTEPAACSTW